MESTIERTSDSNPEIPSEYSIPGTTFFEEEVEYLYIPLEKTNRVLQINDKLTDNLLNKAAIEGF